MSKTNDLRNSIVIGSGPAGLTAAIYLARARLNPLVFGGIEFGGQLMTTTDVENYPGFPEGVTGPDLMQEMIQQSQKFGADVIFKNVEKVDFSGKEKSVWVGGEQYKALSIVIATGASPRKLGLESEAKYWGHGVSSCATCDGAFYKNKVIAVIGGGDSAMEEALFLTKFASKLYLIHRRDSFRASKIMQQRVNANEKIEIIWNSEVTEVLGDGNVVSGLKLNDIVAKKETEIAVAGMFLAIGHIPNVSFLGDSVELDEQGYVKAEDHTQTSVEGVFVAGDVNDHRYRQAITAAGIGCMAALDVEKWLIKNGLDVDTSMNDYM
jgi:thioredoxin reductase (NADPH)